MFLRTILFQNKVTHVETVVKVLLFPRGSFLHNLDFSVQICHCLLLLFLSGLGVNVHCGGDVCVAHDVLNDF